jgi:peptide-methionine (S)-S-oxide reductase
MTKNSIVLGGGCFWCLEAAYLQLAGVESALPGYSGGSEHDANYEAVSTGQTGHVEVVRIVFDQSVISITDIMSVFWLVHDPTSLNQQGADVGPQYASVIFYSDEEQKTAVLASRDEAQLHSEQPIVTRIEPLDMFYEAEDYHHNYFEKNPGASYCQVVIAPKLAKLREHFADKLA